MKLALIVFALAGCSVLRDARDEFRKDITGMQSEFVRLYTQTPSKELAQ